MDCGNLSLPAQTSPNKGIKMIVMKKPIVQKYRMALTEEIIQSAEGPVTAMQGDAIATDIRGNEYAIACYNFIAETYTIDTVAQTFAKLPLEVEATRMTEVFSVTVNWRKEPITGVAGDYKLTYGPDNFGVVESSIFDDTYLVIRQ